ncbi:MAG: hypothetical protein U0R69_14990 [Gaiellales bacterium]
MPPLGRVGTAADVAAATAFLLDDGSFVNGHAPSSPRAGMRASVHSTKVMNAGCTRFQGRIGFVTGGTSGIGKACVERLRREGMTVVNTPDRGAWSGGRRRDRRDVLRL